MARKRLKASALALRKRETAASTNGIKTRFKSMGKAVTVKDVTTVMEKQVGDDVMTKEIVEFIARCSLAAKIDIMSLSL